MIINVYASGSTGNAYRVSDGKTALLLDAGLPVRELQRKMGFGLSSIDGALITHAHKDHSKGAPELARRGVDLFTGKGTIDACGLTGSRVHEIRALEAFDVGTFQVLPFDVQHDAPDPLGFLLTSRVTGERLLYVTDTYYIKYKFPGLNYIMIEANYSEDGIRRSVEAGNIPIAAVPRLLKSHMSIEHLLDMLRANDLRRVRQIYLLHLSSNNSDEDQFKRAVQEATGAEVYVC